MKTRIVKLGVVGVDSGQLMICDPSYISEQFQNPDSKGKSDHAHDIYKHKDGKLWQFCYGGKPSVENVNPIKGTYADIIPEYGMSANDLIAKGLFVKSDIDPTPHIPESEFSYRGICKTTSKSENQGGQLNYLLGHEGVAVAFRSGFGDGEYGVFAEIIETEHHGERIKKVWVELITEKEFLQMNELSKINSKLN